MRVRWNSHRKALRRGDHHNQHLLRAFNKYGEEAFSFKVLEYVVNRDQLRVAEQWWIDALEPELNLAPRAEDCNGVRLSAEARAKISASNLRRWAIATPEERKRIGEAMQRNRWTVHPMLGKQHSAETRAKMSAAKAGKPGNAIGCVRSPETREKIRRAHLGKPLSAEHRAKLSAVALGKKRGPYKIKPK